MCVTSPSSREGHPSNPLSDTPVALAKPVELRLQLGGAFRGQVGQTLNAYRCPEPSFATATATSALDVAFNDPGTLSRAQSLYRPGLPLAGHATKARDDGLVGAIERLIRIGEPREQAASLVRCRW